MKGLFITLEGPDGSGKSTILNNIVGELEASGIDFVASREPGGTPIGEKIRELILDKNNKEVGNETEALLYAASRAQHIHELIEPALEEGRLVISDRFLLSSLAYQGVGRKLGIEEVKAINEFGMRGIEPDLILFFHVDPEETLKRKTKNDGGDRLEEEGSGFHKIVYDGYLELLEKYPDNIQVIDAKKSIEEVTREALGAIKELIEREGV